jgi:hypothetical protein
VPLLENRSLMQTVTVTGAKQSAMNIYLVLGHLNIIFGPAKSFLVKKSNQKCYMPCSVHFESFGHIPMNL